MKQILEKFEEDKAFNQQNPKFSPLNDAYLGDRIDGGFVKKFETNVENAFLYQYTFDNGNGYLYEPESNIILDAWKTPKEFFIHKHIEKCLYDIVVNNSDNKSPAIFCTLNEVEVIADSNPILMFRAVVDRVNKIVSVTNIFVYKRYCGYGKQLLKTIFYRCEDLGYRLFLTEMVPVFYSRMKERGATIIEYGNIVEITDKTNLD